MVIYYCFLHLRKNKGQRHIYKMEIFSLLTKYSLLFINKIIQDANNISLPSASGISLLKPHYFLGQRLCHKRDHWKKCRIAKGNAHTACALTKSVIVHAIMSMTYANNICRTVCRIVCGGYSDSHLVMDGCKFYMYNDARTMQSCSMQWYKGNILLYMQCFLS